MAPTASWEAKAFGLDKVLSRGRQGHFDSRLPVYEFIIRSGKSHAEVNFIQPIQGGIFP